MADKHILKMFDIICHQGYAKSNHSETPLHPLEWQEVRGHIITSINKDVENQNLHILLMGI